jgi:hypothetical protein
VVENNGAAVMVDVAVEGIGKRLKGFFSVPDPVSSGKVCDLLSGVPVLAGVVPKSDIVDAVQDLERWTQLNLKSRVNFQDLR